MAEKLLCRTRITAHASRLQSAACDERARLRFLYAVPLHRRKAMGIYRVCYSELSLGNRQRQRPRSFSRNNRNTHDFNSRPHAGSAHLRAYSRSDAIRGQDARMRRMPLPDKERFSLGGLPNELRERLPPALSHVPGASIRGSTISSERKGADRSMNLGDILVTIAVILATAFAFRAIIRRGV